MCILALSEAEYFIQLMVPEARMLRNTLLTTVGHLARAFWHHTIIERSHGQRKQAQISPVSYETTNFIMRQTPRGLI